MAAAIDDAASGRLPPEGSLYYDYLSTFPVGVSMAMELQPDAEALEAHEVAAMIFTVTKVDADAWIGLPGYESDDGMIPTRTLFEHVVEQMQGENSIRVAHGRDPRKVKREIINNGTDLETSITFFSIYETIELDSDTDSDGEETAAASEGAPRAGKQSYESVRLSLALPAPAPAPAPASAPAPSEADAPAEAEAPAAAPKPDEEPAPEPAMPAVGECVLINGEAALCFKVGKGMYVVAFDDHSWEVEPIANIPWAPCPEEKQCALAGVVEVVVGKLLKVEAYLYGKAVFGLCGRCSMNIAIQSRKQFLTKSWQQSSSRRRACRLSSLAIESIAAGMFGAARATSTPAAAASFLSPWLSSTSNRQKKGRSRSCGASQSLGCRAES